MIRILTLSSSYVFVVKTILHSQNGLKKNQTYTSPEVQNEMLKDMNFCMNLGDVVVEGIKNSDYHNKLVHESSDVSNKEQAMFCVCWVDVDLISCMEVWQRRRYISLFFLVFLFI